jgi:hypothetical protein
MEAAKRTLQLCLRSLPEGCMFQVVSFGSHHTKLFAGALAADLRGCCCIMLFYGVVCHLSYEPGWVRSENG